MKKERWVTVSPRYPCSLETKRSIERLQAVLDDEISGKIEEIRKRMVRQMIYGEDEEE